eukprot:scaffold4786_cov198-Amphora_coffeaeformis.AAC.13
MKIFTLAAAITSSLFFTLGRALEDEEKAPPTLEEIEAMVKDTPAAESICDQYAESKANGLCVAYCEAKDCEEDIFETERSCQVLKDRFATLTGGDTLPCEPGRCPCWDADELPPSERVGQIAWSSRNGITSASLVANAPLFPTFFVQRDICQFNRFQVRGLNEDQIYFCLRDLARASAAPLLAF